MAQKAYGNPNALAMVKDTFATFFRQENWRFDEARFRRACVPGANVRARRVA